MESNNMKGTELKTIIKKEMSEWFSVDKEGLKALQKGKTKTFIINELVQNAWDEDINECKVDINWHDGKVTLRVEDDSPEGVRDISHSYTLFADTYKRRDPTKRGRFNIGEKVYIKIDGNKCYSIKS